MSDKDQQSLDRQLEAYAILGTPDILQTWLDSLSPHQRLYIWRSVEKRRVAIRESRQAKMLATFASTAQALNEHLERMARQMALVFQAFTERLAIILQPLLAQPLPPVGVRHIAATRQRQRPRLVVRGQQP